MRTSKSENRWGPDAGGLAHAAGAGRWGLDTAQNGAAPAERVTTDCVTADCVTAVRLSAERLTAAGVTVASAPASWLSLATLGALRGVGPPLRHQGGLRNDCAASPPNPAVCLAWSAAQRDVCGAGRGGQGGTGGLAAANSPAVRPPVGGRQRGSWCAAGIQAFEGAPRV